ncbi:hypothetical protein DERF_001766 [Dermatophagoides farinae]|uniref:Uncharacterized protein n=1 Tax=Dermatophagoides farinae TaxID=6954 RepID=A0A922I997_DERFA|nr:hypothetical protein DERF_001766 [Dermatophagoides farinae]
MALILVNVVVDCSLNLLSEMLGGLGSLVFSKPHRRDQSLKYYKSVHRLNVYYLAIFCLGYFQVWLFSALAIFCFGYFQIWLFSVFGYFQYLAIFSLGYFHFGYFNPQSDIYLKMNNFKTIHSIFIKLKAFCFTFI